MAYQKKNYGMEGTSGKVGNVIYREKDGKVTLASRPKPSEKASGARAAQQRRFLKASIYAANAMDDAELKAAYAAMVKPGRSAYSVALTDFLNPPVFVPEDTSVDEYFGRTGDTITIGVLDGFKVTGVQCTIRNLAGELVETGPLALNMDGLTWNYTVTTDHNPAGGEITMIAKDRAGNRTKMAFRT
jgi:hypothetical protein